MSLALFVSNTVTAQAAVNPAPGNQGAAPDTPATNPQAAALLAELRDIHLPETGGFGVAPGWLLLGAGCLLLGLLAAVFFLRRKPPASWRQSALLELEQIRSEAAHVSPRQTLAACSRLLRRVGLSLAPREEVAPLTGNAWLGQLDQWHGSSGFTHGPGLLLGDAQYRPESLSRNNPADQVEELDDVLALVEDFIRQVDEPLNAC